MAARCRQPALLATPQCGSYETNWRSRVGSVEIETAQLHACWRPLAALALCHWAQSATGLAVRGGGEGGD